MRHLFILLIISIFLLSCDYGKDGQSKNIIIFFDSIKPNYDTVFLSNGGQAITNEPILYSKLSPTNSIEWKINDTIIITPEKDYAIITHRYFPYSSADFLLKKGDTVHINYIDGVAFVSIQNRNINTFDLNYDYFKRKRYPLVGKLRLSDVMRRPDLIVAHRLLKGEKINAPQVIEEYYPEYVKELEDENDWLDSLHQVKLISTLEYNFYKDRNKYITLGMNLVRGKKDEFITKELSNYNDSIYSNDIAGFYKNYYLQLALNRINKIAPTFKDNKHTEIYDYVVEEDKIISGKLSQDIRQVILGYILNNTSLDIRNEYFNKFASSTTDTALINRLKIKYENLLNPEVAISNDLVLLSVDGKKITFSEVLKQCEGKIVYVDFWASWCEPCLREMPNSKQLRDDEVYKNIVFIYLALNDKKERWEAAWKKACLEDYTHNYMILNSADASFISKYKINSIPRYMIFGKDGRILNPDAPRPSDKKINKILTDY